MNPEACLAQSGRMVGILTIMEWICLVVVTSVGTLPGMLPDQLTTQEAGTADL
jgi:hypothetical protein